MKWQIKEIPTGWELKLEGLAIWRGASFEAAEAYIHYLKTNEHVFVNDRPQGVWPAFEDQLSIKWIR